MKKEKVMTITLMRSDLYDDSRYIGAHLELPARRDEIQEALHHARITGNQKYKIVECCDMDWEELEYVPKNPSLNKLNFLAYRIQELSAQERIAFAGCAMQRGEKLTMQDLINQTYNLDGVQVIAAKNDKELGKFYVENGFVDAFNHVPGQYQEELLKMVDYEKIGCLQRNAEGGVYWDGYYVVNCSREWKVIYDGIHLPQFPEEPSYVFELEIANAFDPKVDETEKGTLLRLPANEKEIFDALKKVDAETLDDCVFYHYDTPFPSFEQIFSFDTDISRMNFLAGRIRELETAGELPKFKAALELTDCALIDLVLDLTQNLDCYDFYPELSTAEDYAIREFINRYQIPENEPVLKVFQYYQCDQEDVKAANIAVTPYGIIRRNDREMKLEHSSEHIGPQMI